MRVPFECKKNWKKKESAVDFFFPKVNIQPYSAEELRVILHTTASNFPLLFTLIQQRKKKRTKKDAAKNVCLFRSIQMEIVNQIKCYTNLTYAKCAASEMFVLNLQIY